MDRVVPMTNEQLIQAGLKVEKRLAKENMTVQESTTQVEQVSPINSALHVLAMEISDAFDRVGCLENKLISVIPDGALKPLEDVTDLTVPTETASPLTHEIREQYRRLIVLSAKLDQLYYAIEL